MNVFHWHLSDFCIFSIESKVYVQFHVMQMLSLYYDPVAIVTVIYWTIFNVIYTLALRRSRGTSTSYNMAARALADLSHEGAKRPSAINQLSARAAML